MIKTTQSWCLLAVQEGEALCFLAFLGLLFGNSDAQVLVEVASCTATATQTEGRRPCSHKQSMNYKCCSVSSRKHLSTNNNKLLVVLLN